MTTPAKTILTSYYRPKPGGCCKRLFRAIRALLDRGHKVHYIAVTPFPITHEHCYFHRFPWPANHTDNYLFWACFHLLAPWQMLFIGFRHGITHAFAFNPSYALLLKLLCAIKQIPLTFFIRGDTLASHKLNKRARWLIKLEQYLEGLAIRNIRVFGNSQTLTNRILERHSYSKPVRHGVIRNDISSLPESWKSRSQKQFHIACVGTLDNNKNQAFALQILQGLENDHCRLLLYGAGRDEAYLKELGMKPGIKDKVSFMGWRDDDRLWDNIDLLLATSLNEGAPNVVLEAIASGTPVLASDIPAHAEILPANALLSLTQPTAWQTALNNFMDNDEVLQDLFNAEIESARQLVFDWDQQITDLITED